ncbi:Uncharacterised protein [Burkholderia pseudomallei]|nr:Uncharacterised protein [Burkholderia pseudomallei]
MKSVASAFISGFRPRRTRENTTSGSVVEPGPERNAESTRSSIDSVNDSSQPESSACEISGSVITKNTFSGVAPRSSAASSSALFSSFTRDCTMIATYDTHSITWPIQIVTIPRPFGQPAICSSATNSSNSEMPWITSGITSGALIMPVYSVKPRKRPKRASTKPAHVPMNTDANAVSRPIFSDSHALVSSSSSRQSAAYHFSEKPDHTVTSFDSLNE